MVQNAGLRAEIQELYQQIDERQLKSLQTIFLLDKILARKYNYKFIPVGILVFDQTPLECPDRTTVG